MTIVSAQWLHILIRWSIHILIQGPGAFSVSIHHLSSIWIPMLKIRQSHYHLIFNMGTPIPGKMVFILWRLSHDMKAVTWHEGCHLTWRLSLDMKAVTWHEGCHLTWRLSLDMEAVTWYGCCHWAWRLSLDMKAVTWHEGCHSLQHIAVNMTPSSYS